MENEPSVFEPLKFYCNLHRHFVLYLFFYFWQLKAGSQTVFTFCYIFCQLYFICCFLHTTYFSLSRSTAMTLQMCQGCHLSFISKFPDFSVIFPWHFTVFHTLRKIKKNFFFFTLMVLIISLLIWGILLKGRICSPREQILSYKSSPQWGGRWASTVSWESTSFTLLNKFSEDSLPKLFIFKFPGFSLTFQVLSKIPWPSTKFPDFSLTEKKKSFFKYFPLTMATLDVQCHVQSRCCRRQCTASIRQERSETKFHKQSLFISIWRWQLILG